MPYQKHDVNNDPVNPGTLLDSNAYERYDESNVIEDPQPASTNETDDYSNQFKNWNADYSPHGPNGEDLNPDVSINIDTESTLTGNTSTGVRRTEDVTGNIAVFSGGSGAITVEGRFFIGDLTRDDLAGWEPLTEYSTDAVQTYTAQAVDVGRRIVFATRATDTKGTVAISISSDIVRVYESVTAAVQTTYTGVKKIGNTLNIYTATGAGGIPPLNYLIQLRFSDTGTGNWDNNSNLSANLAPGERVEYTIPAEQAGRYIQIRTRIRDNNGTGGSGVYQQVWSIAPDSTLQIASPITEGSGFGVALTGEFRVGQSISVSSIPAFQGGVSPVVYEYQWQKSQDGTNWVGFDSPWTVYDPTTILIDNPAKNLNASEVGYLIRVQTRATGNDGERLIDAGEVYGPVVSESPEVFTPTGAVAPMAALDGAYRVGENVNLFRATFTGGAAPYASITVRLYSGFTRTNETLQEWVGAETDGAMIFDLKHIHEDLFLYAETVVVDAVGNETISPIALHNNTHGVLPYKPGLELVSTTENYGLAAPGNTLQVRCAEYSGGIAPHVYDVLLRTSDNDTGTPYQQTTIQSNATPGDFYNLPITNDHLNKYLSVLTHVADNDRDGNGGYKQKFNIVPLGYRVTIPSTPKASGPRYDYGGYTSDLYAEPNYKQGHILRVGDTITLTVPDFFGGETPYRHDLNYWKIYAKKGGASDPVFTSPLSQAPGSSVTFTIPQSLVGNYLKVNFYLYDRMLTSHKFSFSLYSGSNPQASTGLIMSAV